MKKEKLEELKNIIEKAFDFSNNLVEIENIENLKYDDFIYILEKNNYNNSEHRYNTFYCDSWKNLIYNLWNNLQNRNIQEVDEVDDNDKLPCQDIIDLYENHNNCKLYLFKELNRS